MSLQEVIKVTRQKSFMSQETFDSKMNVSVATINRWENGKSRLNLAVLKNLKQFCNENGLSYGDIGKEWFAHSVEDKK